MISPLRSLAVLAVLLAAPAAAQWLPLHPGGGGEIQDLVLDPATPGRVYSLSDVDGLYRSDDYGRSFRSLNEGIHTGAVSVLRVDPTDSGRLFLGTARGVIRSLDGGETWSPMGGSESAVGGDDGERTGLHVSSIAIDPVDPDRVYFANSWGWKHTYGFYWRSLGFNLTSDIVHPGQVYVTDDGGETWDVVTFEPEAGYMNVYSITVNPSAPNEVYVSAHPGLYKSEDHGQTWAKLPTPDGAFFARGATVTPDGQFLLAAFTTEALPAYVGDRSGQFPNNPNSSFYAAPVTPGAAADWVRRDAALPQPASSEGGNPAPEYWNPHVDPRSTAAAGYRVLLGTFLGRQGTYAATFEPDGAGGLTDAAWSRVLWRDGSDGFAYEQGWNDTSILSRFYAYTPTTWPERRVWATGGQSFFEGDPSAPGWPTSPESWRTRYTEFAGVLADGSEAYRTRGIQSTVNWDQAALGSYVVQAQSDNGIIESFDGGDTWTQDHQPRGPRGQKLSNARAAHVFDAVSPAVVLVAAGQGFGGGGATPLHALVSDAPTPLTAWAEAVDAGLGTPTNDVVSTVTAANDGVGVYVAYEGARAAEGGVYFHPDIRQLAQNQGAFERLVPGEDLKKTYKLAVDPLDDDRLFRLTGNQVFRMERGPDGSWTSTEVARGAKDFAVWALGGQTFVAYGERTSLFVSSDAGDSFAEVYTLPTGALGPWEDWLFVSDEPEVRGLVADGRNLYFGASLFKNRKPVGFYRAALSGCAGDLSAAVEDWTGAGAGRHANARTSLAAELVTVEGARYVATPTRGSGLWVRPTSPQPALATAALPWFEAFDSADGATADVCGTAWTTERGALNDRATFAVRGGRFEATNTGGVGVWRSAPIALDGAAAELSVDVQSAGGLETADFVEVFYTVDGTETVVARREGGFNGGQPETVRASGLTGSELVVGVRARNTGATEHYYWDGLLVTATATAPGALPWVEDFALADSTTSDDGPTAWSVDSSGMVPPYTFAVVGGRFEASNTDGVGVWRSGLIDVSGAPAVTISAAIQSNEKLNSGDWIEVGYELDDGPFERFARRDSTFNGNEPETVSVAGLAGRLVRVVIRARNGGSAEAYAWDDVSVTASSGGGLTLTPVADAYTRGGTFRDDTYGTAADLLVSQGSGGADKRFAYLRFDVSDLPESVTSATLRLRGALDSDAAADVETFVYPTEGGAWDEATLTWGTAPGFGTRIGSVVVADDAARWYEVDVTDYVAGLTDGVASFGLKNPDAAPTLTVFGAREGAAPAELVLVLDGGSARRAAAQTPPEDAEAADLGAPYPNPTAGVLTVPLALPNAAEVRGELVDALGRTVAVFASGPYGPGRHALRVEAAGLPGGVYFCRVFVDGEPHTVRVSVIR